MMPATFDLVLSSPPYADSVDSQAHGIDWTKAGPATGNRRRGAGTKHEATLQNQLAYGSAIGQLGSMKDGPTPEDTMTTPRQAGPTDTWQGCYADTWQGVITEAAFAHPAKYSRSLIRRIYGHLKEEGRLAPGMVCLDPFGGVALGALDAMFHGLHWIGCELEPRFHELGNANLALWNDRYRGWPNWGKAVLLNGDSRNLAAVVEGADCVVSSPPYVDTFETRNGPSGLKGVGGTGLRSNGKPMGLSKSDLLANAQGYGHTPGQLGSMKEGPLADAVADAVISSPPYADAVKGQHGETETAEESRAARRTKGGSLGQSARNGGYGASAGNLGNLPLEQDTFWASAKVIVGQCFALLKPGGVAVWVLKAFVRKGKIVDFPGQWRALCEAVGFRHLHTHHASLVTDAGEQGMLFGEPEKLTKARKSFFRRLAESKGSPAIDFEVILCMEKGGKS